MCQSGTGYEQPLKVFSILERLTISGTRMSVLPIIGCQIFPSEASPRLTDNAAQLCSRFPGDDYILSNPILDGVHHGGGSAGDSDLVVDVLQVVLDCFPADDQSHCDLRITLTKG